MNPSRRQLAGAQPFIVNHHVQKCNSGMISVLAQAAITFIPLRKWMNIFFLEENNLTIGCFFSSFMVGNLTFFMFKDNGYVCVCRVFSEFQTWSKRVKILCWFLIVIKKSVVCIFYCFGKRVVFVEYFSYSTQILLLLLFALEVTSVQGKTVSLHFNHKGGEIPLSVGWEEWEERGSRSF